MSRSARLASLGAALIVVYMLLGLLVSSRPPSAFDLSAAGLVGFATPLAIVATKSGLFSAYLGISIAAIVFALFKPAWRERVAYAVVTLLITWKVSDLFKDVFARPRPEHWLFVHEPTFAYSSGHAALSVVVYALYGAFIYRSGLPAAIRVPVATLLWAWTLVVAWSRLALSTHYPTDIIGGWLLAIGMLALVASVFAFAREVRVTRRPAGG